jgi:hypothetical protein
VLKGYAPEDGVWGGKAYAAMYREHPDGSMKYKHPGTGDVLDVDAVLSVPMLDRLTSIPRITVTNVCAGHGLGHISRVATLAFYADKDMALWLVERLAKHRRVSRTSKTPGLHCFGGREWIVVLECRMFDKNVNHVVWWNLVTTALERMVRRYNRKPRKLLPTPIGPSRELAAPGIKCDPGVSV